MRKRTEKRATPRADLIRVRIRRQEASRAEAAADLRAARKSLFRNHVAYTAPVAIDARTRPEFPKELFCDEATAATVTRRWREYFPDGGVEMGDSGLASLDGDLPG